MMLGQFRQPLEHGEELARFIDAQSHYPCRCHDWVWRGDIWELVPHFAKREAPGKPEASQA